jgi:hypothetical protein
MTNRAGRRRRHKRHKARFRWLRVVNLDFVLKRATASQVLYAMKKLKVIP